MPIVDDTLRSGPYRNELGPFLGLATLLRNKRVFIFMGRDPLVGELPTLPRVLIIAENASFKFGGEAALPLHYFRILRRRGAPVWLLCHARTRAELETYFPNDPNIVLIEDTPFILALYKISRLLPDRLSAPTTGFLMRLNTQIRQRRLAKTLIDAHNIEVVHQPIPVSPKEPSLIYGLSVPVVIGPMNGAMTFPPGFGQLDGILSSGATTAGRWIARVLNHFVPGKAQAAALLVANTRTAAALPTDNSAVHLIVENGVDLSLWKAPDTVSVLNAEHTRFIFVGRLANWKAVDLLLEAFKSASKMAPMSLTIVGDGGERSKLENLATESELLADRETVGKVWFSGWRSQAECAEMLRVSDALVLPSLYECGGAVVLEAMATARPVVAADWGGPADYLDESCGILVKPTSREGFVSGLSEALIKLARSPQLREQMGAAGRRKVLEQFDWEKKVDQVTEVFRSCIQAQGSDKKH